MRPERYERISKLGEGQMSVVWLAYDTFTQQQVALKIMTAIPEDDRRNQKARERFHREIEIMRSLHHEHILPILDYGYMDHEKRRVPYLVSRYIAHGSLAEFIRQRPPWRTWSLQQIMDAVMQAAESLYCLHQHQPPIVHEDVKPANFLCTAVDTPERLLHLYLGDFGISRWLKVQDMPASELLGTFQYMAPEQFDRQVHCASDQYALAIMACYLLTGKLPIQAATNEGYLQAHLYEQPLPPSVLMPERIQSQIVDEVILRALEKNPDQRYPTIMAFARALQEGMMQYQKTITELPTERFDEMDRERTLPVVDRMRIPFSAFSIALDPSEVEDDRGLDEPLPARPIKSIPIAVKAREIAVPLQSPQISSTLQLPARPKFVAWSPVRKELAILLYGHVPVLLQSSGELQNILIPHAMQATALSWSPDGHYMVVAALGTLYFWHIATQSVLPLQIRFPVSTIDNIDWSISNQLAVWVGTQIFIYPLTPEQLQLVQPPKPHLFTQAVRSGSMNILRWSPDGAGLLLGTREGTVLCWYPDQYDEVWAVAQTGQKINSLTWSPDGTFFAVALRDNRILGWDTKTKTGSMCWNNLSAMPRMLCCTGSNDQYTILVASSEKRLLMGHVRATAPTASLPGQLLVAYHPLFACSVTIDQQREHVLNFWQDEYLATEK